MMVLDVIFWLSVCGVLYPYAGYPLLLWALRPFGRGLATAASPSAELPSVSLIIPVHNEERRIERKLRNTAALSYPAGRLQVVVVSDGSTDNTTNLIRAACDDSVALIELPARRGKAAALNAGLAHARHELLVFSDASIELERDALRHIVAAFNDPQVGCVSGEDPVKGSGGEALYGRYELWLRRLESAVHSIVGASGSFYAQRRSLCAPFVEGMAPDFLSVLRTVARGSRALSDPAATGAMTSVSNPRQEFERKVRTVIRGMTTLFAHAWLLNPLRTGLFAFELWSHKVMRWLAPFFLMGAFVSSAALSASPVYRGAFVAQAVFYLVGFAALRRWGPLHRSLPGKVALYFSAVNAAIVAGWWQYARGVRQELWTPSQR